MHILAIEITNGTWMGSKHLLKSTDRSLPGPVDHPPGLSPMARRLPGGHHLGRSLESEASKFVEQNPSTNMWTHRSVLSETNWSNSKGSTLPSTNMEVDNPLLGLRTHWSSKVQKSGICTSGDLQSRNSGISAANQILYDPIRDEGRACRSWFWRGNACQQGLTRVS